MKYGLLFVVATIGAMIGCSSSPTAPSPPPVVVFQPPAVTPPVVVAPPPVVIPPAFPPNDPRFDLTFYRQFVHNMTEGPSYVLWRQPEAPRIYLRTIDDAGAPIDALTLDGTQRALETVTGMLTGAFGIAGLERGTDTRQGQRGWITVRWNPAQDTVCGRAAIGGDLLTLYPRTLGCRCSGGPAVNPLIIKHEMGHALGFHHTDSLNDLMAPRGHPVCDMDPSPREQYHASVAYTRPLHSIAP